MLSEKLQNEIQEKYKIGDINRVTRLAGGYWNTVLRLETNINDYVLRISHPTTNIERLNYEHQLVKLIHAHVKEVPLPICSESGTTFISYKHKLITLFPFIEGHLAEPNHDSARKNAAKMLAKLHLVSLQYPDFPQKPGHQSINNLNWNLNHMWDWTFLAQLFFANNEGIENKLNSISSKLEEDCIKEINRQKKLIKAEKEEIQEWVNDVKQDGQFLISGVIHGDFYAGNILTKSNGEITAVIDWDECCREWFIYELARTIWEFCQDSNENKLDVSKANSFIQDYKLAGGPVPEREFYLIIPFIRYVRLIEILFYIQQGLKGQEWDPEYTLHNLKALINLKAQTIL